MAFLSLLDVARRMDPDGEVSWIAELLSQANEFFKDMTWTESNLPFGHKSTVRTALPSGTYRVAYAGVPYTRSKTAQIIDSMAYLEAYSQVDKLIAPPSKMASVRVTEDNAHLEGMSQQQATTFFYGNALTSPNQFTGFAPRFASTSKSVSQNAQNVINCGGTGSSNTSIWLVGWGDMTAYGIYPEGSKAGLIFEDKGDVVPGLDASNNRFEAWTSFFKWDAGLALSDWRYVVRLANIDTTSSGLAGASPPDLFFYLSQAVVKLPTMSRRASGITETDAPDEPAPGINPGIYMNRISRQYADIQAIRDKNVLLKPTEYAGEPVVDFRGVPIRVVDALTSTEATI